MYLYYLNYLMHLLIVLAKTDESPCPVSVSADKSVVVSSSDIHNTFITLICKNLFQSPAKCQH